MVSRRFEISFTGTQITSWSFCGAHDVFLQDRMVRRGIPRRSTVRRDIPAAVAIAEGGLLHSCYLIPSRTRSHESRISSEWDCGQATARGTVNVIRDPSNPDHRCQCHRSFVNERPPSPPLILPIACPSCFRDPLRPPRATMPSPKHEPRHRTLSPSKSSLRCPRRKAEGYPKIVTLASSHVPKRHSTRLLVEAFDSLAMEVDDPPQDGLGDGNDDITSLWEELEALIPAPAEETNDTVLVEGDMDWLWNEIDALTSASGCVDSIVEVGREEALRTVDKPLHFHSASFPQATSNTDRTSGGVSSPLRPAPRPHPLPIFGYTASSIAGPSSHLPPSMPPPLPNESSCQQTMSLGNAGYPRPHARAHAYIEDYQAGSVGTEWERYLNRGV